MHYTQCFLLQLICYYKTTASSVQHRPVRRLIHPLYMLYCSLLGVDRGFLVLSVSFFLQAYLRISGCFKDIPGRLIWLRGRKRPVLRIDLSHQSLLAAQTRVQEAARFRRGNTILSYHLSRNRANASAVCCFSFVFLSLCFDLLSFLFISLLFFICSVINTFGSEKSLFLFIFLTSLLNPLLFPFICT